MNVIRFKSSSIKIGFENREWRVPWEWNIFSDKNTHTINVFFLGNESYVNMYNGIWFLIYRSTFSCQNQNIISILHKPAKNTFVLELDDGKR